MLRPPENSELWICLNCRNVSTLTEHGRCNSCDSDSVAVADVGRSPVRNPAVAADKVLVMPAPLARSEGEIPHPARLRAFEEGHIFRHRRFSRRG